MSLPKEKFVPKPSKYDLLLKALRDLITRWQNEGQYVAVDELESVINKVIK
jgi:hypothetical protein